MRTVELTPHIWDKVDKSNTNGCWLWTGTKNGKGYGYFRVNHKAVMVHRFSYELVHGPIDKGLVVDHICHNPACVNPEHLRPCTNKENTRNQSKGKRNTSGFKGVCWNGHARKWQAGIRVDGHSIHLGLFLSATDAHAAYCRAALRLHGEFANSGFNNNATERPVA